MYRIYYSYEISPWGSHLYVRTKWLIVPLAIFHVCYIVHPLFFGHSRARRGSHGDRLAYALPPLISSRWSGR
jgi:hypothetical protein